MEHLDLDDLRERLKSGRYNRFQMCRDIGVARATVDAFLSGKHQTRPEIVKRISDWLADPRPLVGVEILSAMDGDGK